jgi:hypothetical protein
LTSSSISPLSNPSSIRPINLALVARTKRRSSSELVSVISVKSSIISLNNVLLVNSLFPQHVFPLLYRSHYRCESTLQPAGAWEPAWEPS